MKINLGSSKLKSSYFPISFDSSTTSNFGECIPCFAHELPPNSHLNVDMRSAVRFAPLSLPTFGKAFLHSYLYCHSLKDLYPPFDNVLTQTPYTSSTGLVYVPLSVPSMPLFFIWHMVLSHASWSVIKIRQSDSQLGTSPVSMTYTNYESYEIPNYSDIYTGSRDSFLVYNLLFSSLASTSSLFNYTSVVKSRLYSDTRLDNFFASKDVVFSSYDPSVVPMGSDFIVPLSGLSPTLVYIDSISGALKNLSLPALPDDSYRYALCIRLNNSGKFLRKLFMGLGYQITPYSTEVSMLPLFAFFRSYFDTFAPKRFVKYDQTYFGRLMVKIVNSGQSMFNNILNGSVRILPGLVDDLLSCFYTKDTDYYSAQIIGMINDYGADLKQRYIGVDLETEDNTLMGVISDVNNGNVPAIQLDNGTGHTQAQQNVLSRLTEFVNRRSVLGGKIADLLESVFGIKKKEVMSDNPYVGSSVIDVDFSDVFSTAETAEASLGEYAGKAMGVGSNDKFNISVDIHSIVICFSVLVPRTQYVQGVNPNLFHISQYDFYNPQFDGLTLLPTERLSFVAPNPIFESNLPQNSFGNLPIYTEYKTKSQGILNGDLSLLSTKGSYDSFTMDETFSDYVYTDDGPEGTKLLYAVKPSLSRIVSGTMWRYIGRWLWLGNFDRIFVNTRQSLGDLWNDFVHQSAGVPSRDIYRSDDNLIIHNVVDLKINASMLPLADSFMTKDLNELDNGVGVTAQSE